MLVARPAVGTRAVVPDGELSLEEGLVGDNWRARGNRKTADGSADPLRQLTLMNARAAKVIAGPPDRWPLAGDQLFVDFDLSGETLPPGSRLRVGSAVLEITEPPHTGCAKFRERFGAAALAFVNSLEGRALNLRGVNARVIVAGRVQLGDRNVRAPRPQRS